MKRFKEGDIITWGNEIGCAPQNITPGKFYNVVFIKNVHANGIFNDINDLMFNFTGFININDYLWKTKGIKIGSIVTVDNNADEYIVEGFKTILKEVIVNLIKK